MIRHAMSEDGRLYAKQPDGEWKELGTVTNLSMTFVHDASYQPTRWQRFCYWMRDFWLEPRW